MADFLYNLCFEIVPYIRQEVGLPCKMSHRTQKTVKQDDIELLVTENITTLKDSL